LRTFATDAERSEGLDGSKTYARVRRVVPCYPNGGYDFDEGKTARLGMRSSKLPTTVSGVSLSHRASGYLHGYALDKVLE
jgi:hypothetical protein